MLYDQQFCVNNDFGRFSAIFIGLFFLISGCTLDVLETLHISEIDREQLRNQQHFYFIITMNNNSRVL